MGDIEKLCRRIIIVNAGQIVQDDSVEHLVSHYLDKSPANMQAQDRACAVKTGNGEAQARTLEEIIVDIYKSKEDS